jgi:iron(III) transport system permease protein
MSGPLHSVAEPEIVSSTAPEVPKPVPRRAGSHARGWRWGALAALLAVLVLWPLASLQLTAFGDGLEAFRRVWETPGIGAVFGNTVVLALGSVVIAVLLGTLLAWSVHRCSPRLRGVLAVLPILPLMIPAVASISGWTYLLSPRVGFLNRVLRDWGLGSGPTGPIDVFGMPAIVILTGFSLTSFVYLFVHASLEQRGGELEAAAAVSGGSPLRVMCTITLPLLRPAIVYSAGITFLLGLGQFAAPLLLGAASGIDTVTTVMYRVSQTYPVDYAFGAVLDLPLVAAGVLVVVVQRWTLRDERRFATTAGKGRYVVGKPARWAAVPVLAYVLLAVVLPLLALVVVALSPFWSGRIDPSVFTVEAFARALGDGRTLSGVGTSLTAALLTLLIVMPIGFVAATGLLKRTNVPAPIRSVIDTMSTLTLGMPAAIFGFALLFAYSGAPFRLYGTTAIIVVAYVTLMIPHAIRPQLSAMIATGPEYAEASRASGAGILRTALMITVPMVRRGLAVATVLVVVLVFHEFAASVMVRSPQMQVMGTLLLDQWTSGTAPDVAVIALLMVLVTTVGVVAALAVGGRRALEEM